MSKVSINRRHVGGECMEACVRSVVRSIINRLKQVLYYEDDDELI